MLSVKLSPSDAAQWSEKIMEQVISLPSFQNARTVMLYASTAREPESHELIKVCLREKRVFLPKVTKENITCEVFLFRDLSPGAHGILEPKYAKAADPLHIDVILIPGLAFDKKGYRIGHGGGYYDRFLQKTGAVKIGVCFEFQLLDKVPKEKHDVKMDVVVTEHIVRKMT